MVKKSPRILNVIIHGLVAIITAIISIQIFTWIIKFGLQSDFIWMGLFIISLFVLASYSTINLIRKDEFTKDKKYSFNLFSGGIIITIFLAISSLITEFTYSPEDLLGLVTSIITVSGVILSFIMGFIGFIIDKVKSNFRTKKT